MKVSPSILSVKQSEFINVIKKLEELNVPYLHLDVMDGKFVPNKTYDEDEVKNIKMNTSMVIDTHLMIESPHKHFQKYIDAGSDIVTFHVEAEENIKDLILEIKKSALCGISIKPKTTVEEIKEYLPLVDLVLVMSVEPGFGGQKFMEASLHKIEELDKIRKNQNYHYLIEVDGGINQETAKLVKASGADIVVVGTYLMNSENICKTYKELEKL